jgi:flagellar basal-body rod modification protein FlgD
MAVNLIGSATGGAANIKTTNPLTDLGSSQFMQLLLAQLRNQNPLEPMQDKDFMGQITQVNSLQELQKMNRTLDKLLKTDTLTKAAGLMGKTVEVKGPDGQTRSGEVTGLSLQNGDVLLWLGGETVPLASVTRVSQGRV